MAKKKKIDFCSNSSVLDGLLNCLPIPRPPVPPIPSVLTLLAKSRPGLSSSKTTGAIISRLSEAGIINSSPEEEKKIRIIVEEIFNALQQDAKLTLAVSPGIAISAAGPPILGAPVVGSTTAPGNGTGILS